MPPLKSIDRGLDGDALRALEKSGHGRRLAIVDASYNIPRWAEVVNYHGSSSADALFGIVKLVPVEEASMDFMVPDPDKEGETRALEAFQKVAERIAKEMPEVDAGAGEYPRLDKDSDEGAGFYTVVNDQEQDTLFVRTRDRLPYACATFVIGHAQVAVVESPAPEAESEILQYATYIDMKHFVREHPELSSRAVGYLWSMLMRKTNVGEIDVPLEKQGKMTIDDELLEVIRIGENYNPSSYRPAWQDPYASESESLSMNLETLEKLYRSGHLREIKLLGPTVQAFVQELLKSQR
ncbi:hypothetical protein HYW36_01445 [Candidatus Saccharibacteria bacterium]|nr:hypothetical protein [Candidatus Saccharibacteria bacterium]